MAREKSCKPGSVHSSKEKHCSASTSASLKHGKQWRANVHTRPMADDLQYPVLEIMHSGVHKWAPGHSVLWVGAGFTWTISLYSGMPSASGSTGSLKKDSANSCCITFLST